MPLSWIGSLILSGCHFSPNCAVESMQCPKYNFCGNWQVYSKKYKRAKDLGLHTYTHTQKKKQLEEEQKNTECSHLLISRVIIKLEWLRQYGIGMSLDK